MGFRRKSLVVLYFLVSISLSFTAERDTHDANNSGTMSTIVNESTQNLSAAEIGGTPKKPDYLYSTPHTQRLASLEEGIYEAMKTYVKKMEVRMDIIQRYIEDYETSSVNMMNDATQEKKDYTVIANPLVTHRMIRRFSVPYDLILKDFEENQVEKEFLSALKEANPESIPYPSFQEDYRQSLYSLYRIQKYSNLATKDMMEGRLGDLNTNVNLLSSHAFDIGNYLSQVLKVPAHATAIEWLEAALEKAEKEGENEHFIQTVKDDLTKAVKLHDKFCIQSRKDYEKESCFNHTIGDLHGKNNSEVAEGRRCRSTRTRTSSINQNSSKLQRKNIDYSFHVRRNFISTCSGIDLRDEAEKSSLFCWYESNKAPYLAIAPLKFEKLSNFPPLHQIYDILTPSGSERLIKKATPTLVKSKVVNYSDPKRNDLSDGRTSSHTWLDDDEKDEEFNTFLRKLGKHVEYATGLNVLDKNNGHRASEDWQVATYRPSHHYAEHLDAFKDERRAEKDGNRIATFMFYLKDVDVGGHTGFPVAGIGAKPVAGSAVFWYNLRKNGRRDKRTWHGGCPVAHGVKWVANKWILHYENWNKKPCTLNPEE